MAENVTLNPVVTFTNDTSAVNTVNGNYTTIANAFTDVLSRAGNTPNPMLSNLDMNNNQVINLPPPGTINSPARLVDVVSNPTVTVPPTGTSGGVVGFLNGNNTYSGTSTFTNTVTLPSNTVTRANLTQGIARSVIGVTGNFTANVADIQGTSRQVLSVSALGNSLSFAQPQGDQLKGTITNDNANAGNVGEYISATVGQGSPVTITTGVTANITSITLTAGDWDIWGNAYIIPASSTNVSFIEPSVSLTSATTNFVAGFYNAWVSSGVVTGNFPSWGVTIGPNRVSISSSTTYFLTMTCNFTVSTNAAFGTIQARRVR